MLDLRDAYGDKLTMRVSLDHYSEELHDTERSAGAFAKTVEGIDWLARGGFRLALAGRTCWGESEADLRDGYAALIAARGWPVDAYDPAALVLFPEMDLAADVPEITEDCWGILGKNPADVMCASSRMVVKRKGAGAPVVLPCTLLPYDPAFEMGDDAGGGRARRWRHVRTGRGQALPRPLRQVLRARRRLLLGVSTLATRQSPHAEERIARCASRSMVTPFETGLRPSSG